MRAASYPTPPGAYTHSAARSLAIRNAKNARTTPINLRQFADVARSRRRVARASSVIWMDDPRMYLKR